MMKLLTKTTALLLWACAVLVMASPAHGAEGERTLNFAMYCETEAAMRTLMGHLATGDGEAAQRFYMDESTPCYGVPSRMNATVVQVVARVPLLKGAVAVIMKVRAHNKAGSLVYVFVVMQEPATNDTKGRGGNPDLGKNRRDV